MTRVLAAGALVLALLGVMGSAMVLAARERREALRVLLDFLLAAGLLRLAGDPDWRDVAVAAAVVVIRLAVRPRG